MICILEGPDGGGKTTLARQLCEHFQAEYVHEGPPPAGVATLVHYGKILQTARQRPGNTIFDRLALGERVYGPILRGRDTLGENGMRLFHRIVTAGRAVEVLCLPAYDVAMTRWRQKEDLVKDAEMYRAVYDRYFELSDDQHFYDWTEVGAFDMLCDNIALGDLTPLPPQFIGDPGASFLIVGDRGSEPDSPTANLPFYGETNSSGWLDRMLRLAGFREDELMLVNAYRWQRDHPDWDTVIPEDILPPAPNMTVIALGNNAAERCRQLSIEHRKLPHPQYWKRFHAKDERGFVNLLQACRQ